MNKSDLKTRIQRFRQEYLDTAEGRQHAQTMIAEEGEVQAIYEELRKRQKAGEDVTDETLRRLLPHNNTRGNRERGARISTWPCIKKDVKSWFEGADWKQPAEWPDTATWLLDIVEAGAAQDWEGWRKLAGRPLQKGFACGFITPIVHCLSPQLPVINSKVVKTNDEIAAALGLGPRISSALDEYPENQRYVLDLVECLQELNLNGVQEWDIFCHWNVAKKLGGREMEGDEIELQRELLSPELPSILKELPESQHDTKNPARFESAVAAAFSALGFDTEHIGGAGEADVVARAMLGDEGFSVVVDAKTCQSGTNKGNINFSPLKKHQEQHEADYAVVVSPAFSQGDTISDAQSRGIGLLTTERLIKLVEEAFQRGMSLYALKEAIGVHGLIDVGPETYRAGRDDIAKAVCEVLDVFELHHRGDDSSTGLTSESVYWLLKGGGARLPEQHIEAAIQFLANPVIGVLEKREGSFVLTLPATMAHARVDHLAKSLVRVGRRSDPA